LSLASLAKGLDDCQVTNGPAIGAHPQHKLLGHYWQGNSGSPVIGPEYRLTSTHPPYSIVPVVGRIQTYLANAPYWFRSRRLNALSLCILHTKQTDLIIDGKGLSRDKFSLSFLSAASLGLGGGPKPADKKDLRLNAGTGDHSRQIVW